MQKGIQDAYEKVGGAKIIISDLVSVSWRKFWDFQDFISAFFTGFYRDIELCVIYTTVRLDFVFMYNVLVAK